MTEDQAFALGVADGESIVSEAVEMIGPGSTSAPVDDAALMVDGWAYSPSWRAMPNASQVWDANTELQARTRGCSIDLDRAYESGLDHVTNAFAHEGYSLSWDDGCLWLYGPEYVEQD